MVKHKIISFHGSRILDNDEVLKLIDEKVKQYKPDYIITHGEASGVCEMARDYCRKNAIPLKLHFLDRAKHARGCYHHRSLAVIKECDHCIFIHDGKSIGTKNEMEIARKLGKTYEYFKVEDQGVEPIFGIEIEKLFET